MDISYYLAKLVYRIKGRDKKVITNYFRNRGIKIGDNANICSNIVTQEAYLIEIGNNVTVSFGVTFITHDASVGKIFGVEKGSDVCGKIVIGDNCFIGAHSIIMYGVYLADNIIVAAGSVVTKSFKEEKVIIGGNPAQIIGTWDNFSEKMCNHTLKLHCKNNDEKKHIILASEGRLIVR